MITSEEAFGFLGSSGVDGLMVRESQVQVAAGPVLHAIDPAGRRHLLIPLDEHANDVKDDASRGVVVLTRTLIRGDEEKRFIDVRCEDVRLNDLFSTVCDEIIEHCRTAPDSPGLVVVTVLDRWRDLLGPSKRTLLSEQQIKGLLAELHVLEHLAARAAGEALTLWTGADQARHDFTGAMAACEVKASSLVDRVQIHVNGLTQLQAPPGASLLLVVERFERVPVGGDSIPQVVARLRALGIPEKALFKKLLASGVHPTDFPVYSELRFTLLERRLYLVADDFPRITSAMLMDTPAHDRVSAVEYVVDLGAQPPAPLDDSEWDSLPHRLLGGRDEE